MRIALSRDGETFEEPRIVETPKDFDAGMLALRNLATELLAGEKALASAGGIAGTLSKDKSQFIGGPNLLGWGGKPVRASLQSAFGCPVFVENDTAIVGLGEAVVGSGKGYPICVYMTVSTGVGGVRIVNEQIDVSSLGFEPGHQIIDAGRGLQANTVGGDGLDLEGIISGTAVTKRYGKKPYEITDEVFWDEMARLLAYGLNNTIVHWSPDVVVIGGSMMKKIGIPVERVTAHLKGILHIYPQLPPVVHSALGDIGGLHGALHFVKQSMAKNSLS